MLKIQPLAVKFDTEYEARLLGTELWDVGINGDIDWTNKILYVDNTHDEDYVRHVINRIQQGEIT